MDRDNKLDAFLIRESEAVYELIEAQKETDRRVFAQFINKAVEICEDIIGNNRSDWVIKSDYPKVSQMYAYSKSWVLRLKDEKYDYFKAPALWLPDDYHECVLSRLLNLDGSEPIHADISATPLSRYIGKLQNVQDIWKKRVGKSLEDRGWKFYNNARGKAEGYWGHRFPIQVSAEELAKWFETGKPGKLFAPIEKVAGDICAVAPAISRLVEKVREKDI